MSTTLDVPAAIINLTIPQFAGYSFDFTYKINGTAVNLGGYSALAQIRDQEDRLQTSFAVTLGGALGTVNLVLTSAQTARLKPGKWDILLTPTGGEPIRLVQGDILISSGISRSGM